MLDNLLGQIVQNPRLRYMVYPFWSASPAVGRIVAAVLVCLISAAVGYLGFRLAKRPTDNMGSLQTPSRYAAAVTAAAVAWLLAEPLIDVGRHIHNAKQLLLMGVVFWVVSLAAAVIAAAKYLRPPILIRKTRDYRDFYLRGTRVVGDTEFNRRVADAFKFAEEEYQPIRLGRLVIPVGAENYHFAFAGGTGAGKSQSMYPFVQAINERGQSMVIFDIGGDFWRRFHRHKDEFFNPFLDGSFPWNPLHDIEREQDCYMLAAAICSANESDQAGKRWTEYGRSFLTSVLLSMGDSKDLEQFLYWATEAQIPELAELLRGTPAAAFVQENNEEVFQSIRTTVVTYLQAWPFLLRHIAQAPDDGQGIRRWIRERSAGKHSNALYLSIKDSEMAAFKHLIATFYGVVVQEALDIPKFDNRLWIFLDELDSLGVISSLKDGLTKLRKHNVTMVLGFQTTSQLNATYGKEITDVILVNARIKVVMNCQGQTAEVMSKWFGQQEVKRIIKTRSNNTGSVFNTTSGDTVTSGQNIQIVTTPAVMPSEFTSLPNLSGYVMAAGGIIGQFKVKYSE